MTAVSIHFLDSHFIANNYASVFIEFVHKPQKFGSTQINATFSCAGVDQWKNGGGRGERSISPFRPQKFLERQQAHFFLSIAAHKEEECLFR